VLITNFNARMLKKNCFNIYFYKKKMKNILVLLAILILPLDVFSQDISLHDAQKEYNSGDHESAFKIWKNLADNGDIVAMNNLGYLHEKGEGVKKDLKLSLKYYLKAANSGFPTAQYNVGEIYAEGRGIKENKVVALKWFILAGIRGDKDAQIYYNKIFDKLTKDQVEEANKLVKDWKVKLPTNKD